MLRRLLLIAATVPSALRAHADTITTDHVAFTFATSATPSAAAATHQYTFSFVDGIAAQSTGGNHYGFAVTIDASPETSGQALPGYFQFWAADGRTVLNVAYPGFGVGVSGLGPSPFKSIGFPSPGTAALFFQPGTYVISNAEAVYLTGYSANINASYSITQTTTGAATPVSVTPEPSTFLLLGSGLLGVGSVVRRRLTGVA